MRIGRSFGSRVAVVACLASVGIMAFADQANAAAPSCTDEIVSTPGAPWLKAEWGRCTGNAGYAYSYFEEIECGEAGGPVFYVGPTYHYPSTSWSKRSCIDLDTPIAHWVTLVVGV